MIRFIDINYDIIQVNNPKTLGIQMTVLSSKNRFSLIPFAHSFSIISTDQVKLYKTFSSTYLI